MEISSTMLQLGMGAFTLLGSINAYFIKALVNKLDQADKNLTKNEEQIRQLKEQIEDFSVFIKDISDLKSEVAVLKYALEKRGG